MEIRKLALEVTEPICLESDMDLLGRNYCWIENKKDTDHYFDKFWETSSDTDTWTFIVFSKWRISLP